MTQPTVPRTNNLWAYAATELPDNVKRNINFNRPDKLNILAELHATAEHSRQRSVESRWKYARKNGEVVIVRDVLGKIIRWVDTFKQVGDAAVQYDPGHASLPWAGIRFLLQVAVNDIAKYGSVVEDLARVAELICRFALIKQLYLQGTSKEAKALELAVVKLYARTLVFLSTAKQYLEQGTAKRIAKSAFLTESDLGLGLNEIQVAEKDVDRCMALVDKMDNTENYAKLIGILARIDMPLRRMDDGLNNIHDDLQASKRTRIVQWLSPEPYIQHHKQNMQGVLTGTGQWLLADPIFKRWKDDSASSILWLHGIPGSGKSKLVSVVIEEAVARYKAGDSPQPVFFYCSRNPAELTRSEPQAILASLARQLSCLEPGKPLLEPSVSLYREKEAEGFASGPLQMDETLNLVLQLIAQYPLTTIVIDAMDECDPQKRHELLKALEKILQNSSSLVKIFVSSRNDQDIVLRLRNYPNLEIDSRRNCDDIARFVNEQVEELVQDGRLLSYSDSETEMKKLIVGKVIEGAAGMFRWASMQLQYLCSFELDDDIKSSLGRLPPDLNTLYDELYEMLSTKPGRVQVAVFKNTLCWLLCARKTLSTEELLCAVSIDSESGSSVKVPSKDLVLKICNNFIVFDPQLDTFRFAHLSVREYLEQRPEYGSTTTNALAAEMCLWIVLSASSNIATEKLLLQLGYSANALPKAFEQICTYADIYWPEHCKSAEEQRRSGKLKKMLQHMLSGFGGSGSIIALWNKRLRKHLAEYDYWDVKMPLEDTFPRVDSETCIGIFVSCAFDFEELIGAKVEDSAEAKDSLNRNNRSPLHIATTNGSCASVAKLLMMDQPRVETTQEVVVAAARSYRNGKEIMTLLLDKRGDEVQITQEVVVAAAGNEYNGKEIITLLLDKRGDEVQITQEVVVAAAGNYRNGKEVMALLLDKRGDEVQITQEVVVAAAGNKYNGKEIITLLLDKRGDEVQITQEVVVAAAGNEDGGGVVKYLHQIAAIDITDAVIQSAATSGQESTLRLFDHWAKTSIVKKTWFDIAGLCAAAKKGDGEAVLKFTQQGVPPDERDTRRVTPLWHAAARGHTGTVRALLETNAVNVNAASVSKLTPLFWPAAHGYVEVVKLLLDYGAQQSYEDKDGRSPLTIARIYGQTKVVEILETKNVRNLSVGA
ncbi:hypothetical protein L13192_03047 [Pyrenophora tritici-repentis]|nr:hypothetical protein L13192_03047 [Pyrenophora tritici-repentis]